MSFECTRLKNSAPLSAFPLDHSENEGRLPSATLTLSGQRRNSVHVGAEYWRVPPLKRTSGRWQYLTELPGKNLLSSLC